MRRSFKCQSHWTHILQNKDSLFVKCCLLSESLATMHRAPQPHLLRKKVSGSIGRGVSAPWSLLGEEESPLVTARLSQTLGARVGTAVNRERPGIKAGVPPCPCSSLRFGILFSHSAQGPEPSQQPIIEHHGALPSHANAGRSGTRPCTANVRAFQKIH